jgi:acetyl esterase
MTSPVPDVGPLRAADLQLRGADGPLRSRVYWPRAAPPAPPLLVWFPDVVAPVADRDAFVRALCSPAGLVVVSVGYRPPPEHAVADAAGATAWAADHAAELEAAPGRLAVGGTGAGAVLARFVADRADAEGWPPIAHLLLPGRDVTPAAAAAELRAALDPAAEVGP